MSAWTGITENGSRYQQYIDNPYAPEWMISLNQSISGGYDMRGTWSHQELPLEIYGLLPDGGTGQATVHSRWTSGLIRPE